MLTGHNYIVFLSGKYRGCDFPSHVLPPRNHHKPSAGIPCADPGYPHLFSVCLMFTASLDIPLSPQVQFLFFLSRYLPLHLQILEHDHICMVFFAYLTIAPAVFLPSSVFRRFVYAHLPCVCAEPCSLWNLRIRPSVRYIRSFSLG